MPNLPKERAKADVRPCLVLRVGDGKSIYDLRKAAVSCNEPLAQRCLMSGRTLYLCMENHTDKDADSVIKKLPIWEN